MAVDTRNKRAAAQNSLLPWLLNFPAADGTIDQADAQQVQGVYPGILAGEPVVVDGGTGLRDLNFRRHRLRYS